MSKQKKEYRIIYDNAMTDTEGEMNKLAADGWTLRAAIPGHFKSVEGDWNVAQFVMERDVEPGAAA